MDLAQVDCPDQVDLVASRSPDRHARVLATDIATIPSGSLTLGAVLSEREVLRRELRENVEVARERLGQLEAALAEVRAELKEGHSLMALDVLQALAVEQTLLNALQANSERLLAALQRNEG
jgi:hypothetical protein